MYLVGDNSFHFPWQIPKDFPRDALDKRDRDNLIKFIDDYNSLLRFSNLEKLLFAMISVLYMPAARHLHKFMRRDRYKSLQIALYRHFPPKFWRDNGDNKSLRFYCNDKDFMLAYIDFIDF